MAWGYNYYGQCNVPSPNTGFTAIAAGGDHSLGLKNLISPSPKCTVTAGKTQRQDAFSISGNFALPWTLDFNNVKHIDVNIISLIDNASIYRETVVLLLVKGKFKYTHKIPSG